MQPSSIVEPGEIYTSREETQGMAGAKRVHDSVLLIGRYKVHFDRFLLCPITALLCKAEPIFFHRITPDYQLHGTFDAVENQTVEFKIHAVHLDCHSCSPHRTRHVVAGSRGIIT